MRGDERAALLRGLHDERGGREATDETVALPEVPGERRGAERKFRDQAAAAGDVARERLVRAWIDAIGARAHHRDRRALFAKRAAMRRRIDAMSEAAHHGKTCLRERA